jgi:acyl carrier protein
MATAQLSEIVRTVRDIFADETGLDLSGFDENVRFQDDLELNSIDFIGPIMKLESRYGIRFQQTDFANTKTVKDVADLVLAKLQARAAGAITPQPAPTPNASGTAAATAPNATPPANSPSEPAGPKQARASDADSGAD